jgi:hypothetical protein
MRTVLLKKADVVSVKRKVYCSLSAHHVVTPVSNVYLPIEPVVNALSVPIIFVKFSLVNTILILT